MTITGFISISLLIGAFLYIALSCIKKIKQIDKAYKNAHIKIDRSKSLRECAEIVSEYEKDLEKIMGKSWMDNQQKILDSKE